MLEILKSMINEYSSELIALVGVAISTLIVLIKTKKSSLQKKLYQLNAELALNFNPNDYYIVINGVYYSFDEVKIIKKGDVPHEKES